MVALGHAVFPPSRTKDVLANKELGSLLRTSADMCMSLTAALATSKNVQVNELALTRRDCSGSLLALGPTLQTAD
jgi:hypothetical protein